MPPQCKTTIKFYKDACKVVVTKLIKKPEPPKLKADTHYSMRVILSPTDKREIVKVTGKLEDVHGQSGHQCLTTYIQYKAVKGGHGGGSVLTDPAELELTLTNTPADDPSNPVPELLSLTDPDPDGVGDPGDGPLILF